jgi:hypothetical protein
MTINVSAAIKDLMPPFTSQIILEDIMKNHIFSRDKPLKITIEVNNGYLEIIHNKQPKLSKVAVEEGLNNIAVKYRLLSREEIRISENTGERTIILPILNYQEINLS